MKAVTKMLAGAAVTAAAIGGLAAPAAAQFYPGYGGYGYGQSGGLGQILNVILNAQQYGYGYQGYNNDRAQIDRCAAAVEQRLNGGYAYGGYNQQYGQYGQQYPY